MRTLGYLLKLIGAIIIFPFWLIFTIIDWLFIDWPKEILANRWRKNAKVGDRAYFVNILGTKTVGKITRFYKDGDVGFETSNSSQGISLKSLYPAREDDF